VLPFAEIDKDKADLVGSKMANIGEVKNRLKLKVPGGFVVTSAGYQRFFEANELQNEIDRRLQASEADELDQYYALSADIQQLIIRSRVPEDLEREIMDAYHALEEDAGEKEVRVSMRSSALGEDAADTSFAGQYRSELNVSPDYLIDAYKDIVASKYSLQAVAYRHSRGILDEDVSMCVGCMVMVNAVAGGVIYSRNPLNIRDDSLIINAVWGLPKSVVDGSVAPDTFIISRREPLAVIHKDIKVKDYKFVCYPDEGVCRLDVTGEGRELPSIRDDQAVELARIALQLEEYYGTPQDVEWAIDGRGEIFVLQCRPLKQTEVAEKAHGRAHDEAGRESLLLEGGDTASSGVACAPVFVLRKNSDALQFPRGAVLVTAQALPRWAALLNRAAAVVTEQGSVAGHLANVAREFGVPSLFGVVGATAALETGQEVTVDADGLRIYRGRIESLLTQEAPKKNLMEGSPVHDVLREVIQHIVPLYLLDPDSTDFRPRNCRTMHDITRFCHEKSVHEMFSFGKEHHFSERASKQLYCDVPMQWWFINLDDGFREDVPGKFVLLDNIVSIPVLALWEGINAVPWEGPPPVDARGFMAVLLEASANPALDPSMPSHYTNRNYFMISKNFCSLSSRFGFHFSTVETLVGDRANENYISFQFKGGAADYQRRLRRAQFVASLLEEYGFRVEVKDDGVFARMEGFDEEFMKTRLRMLGYLLMHTRQLDMIMANDAAYHHHRSKMMQDIDGILNPNLATVEHAAAH
jgi:pyruvate,water dikinase